MTDTFVGKVAIVTGASRGIGRAIALRLARDGAAVVLAARSADDLGTVAAEIVAGGGAAEPFAVDLRHPDGAQSLLDRTIAVHGGVDIVVNNAGATRRGDFLALDDEAWADGFALKFFAAVRLVRAAWPQLRQRGGAVLNIIGVGGRAPAADQTISGAVNAAGMAFTKAMAERGVQDGVRVNAINPGLIRTDRLNAHLQATARETGMDVASVTRATIRDHGITRIGEPEDIANLAAFVLSREGALLQGALIDIDAGKTKAI